MISASTNKLGTGVWFKSIQQKNRHFNTKTFVPFKAMYLKKYSHTMYHSKVSAEPSTVRGKVTGYRRCTNINSALRIIILSHYALCEGCEFITFNDIIYSWFGSYTVNSETWRHQRRVEGIITPWKQHRNFQGFVLPCCQFSRMIHIEVWKNGHGLHLALQTQI